MRNKYTLALLSIMHVFACLLPYCDAEDGQSNTHARDIAIDTLFKAQSNRESLNTLEFKAKGMTYKDLPNFLEHRYFTEIYCAVDFKNGKMFFERSFTPVVGAEKVIKYGMPDAAALDESRKRSFIWVVGEKGSYKGSKSYRAVTALAPGSPMPPEYEELGGIFDVRSLGLCFAPELRWCISPAKLTENYMSSIEKVTQVKQDKDSIKITMEFSKANQRLVVFDKEHDLWPVSLTQTTTPKNGEMTIDVQSGVSLVKKDGISLPSHYFLHQGPTQFELTFDWLAVNKELSQTFSERDFIKLGVTTLKDTRLGEGVSLPIESALPEQ